MKHLLTLTAVLTWLVMVAVLVERQRPPAAIDLANLPPVPAESTDRVEEWFGVYQGRKKLGHAHRVAVRTPAGHRFEDETSLTLAMLGTPQPFTTALVADTDGGYALRAFRFSLVSPATRFTASGTSDGSRLEVQQGDATPLVIPLREPVHLPSTLRPRLAATKPAPGARYQYQAFSPLTLRNEPIVVTVDGPDRVGDQEALRITEEHQGMRARVWLAEDGGVLREEAMLGFVLEREPRERALAGVDASGLLDLPMAMRIPLAGTIAEPRTRATLALRVSGDAADRIPDDPPRQHVHDGVLHVRREALPTAAGHPPAGDLAPSPFIEADDPAIVARAREIVGDAPDASSRARRLVTWVHVHMTQEPAMTVPSAREVLRTLRGDCNEHAVLLAALARAAGIPARVAAGAVFLDDGFYYHAWNELWVGGWVSADAVFDQLPVDATHVKLIDGGPERHLLLAGLVGRLAFAAEPDS